MIRTIMIDEMELSYAMLYTHKLVYIYIYMYYVYMPLCKYDAHRLI